MLKHVVALIFILISANGFACSCIGRASVKESIRKSDVVFVGRVLSVEDFFIGDTSAAKVAFGIKYRDSISKYKSSKSGYGKLFQAGIWSQKKYTFKVIQFYKGKFTEDTVSLFTGNGGGDCGIRFIENVEYIVYGYKVNFEKMNLNYLSIDSSGMMLSSNVCTRTRKMDHEELNRIEYLRKLKFVSEEY